MAFLNPERVERQGGQNQLCERSTEKGLFKEKPEEKIEGKIPHGFSGIGAMLAGPSKQSQKRSKRPEGTWLRKKTPQNKNDAKGYEDKVLSDVPFEKYPLTTSLVIKISERVRG